MGKSLLCLLSIAISPTQIIIIRASRNVEHSVFSAAAASVNTLQKGGRNRYSPPLPLSASTPHPLTQSMKEKREKNGARDERKTANRNRRGEEIGLLKRGCNLP